MDRYFQISHYLDELAERNLTANELEGKIRELLEQIRSDKPTLVPILLNKLKRTQNPALAFVVGLALQQMNDPAIYDAVVALLHDPTVGDEVKMSLISVFVHYGGDVETLDVNRVFKHPPSSYLLAVGQLLDAIAEDENVISLFLDSFAQLPKAIQIGSVQGFGSLNDERALKLLAVLAEYWDRDVASAAIEAIGSIGSGKSLTVLDNLFNYRESAWGIIEKSIQKLRRKGLSPEALDPPPAPLRECLVTAADGRGSSILVVCRRDGPRRYDAQLFMLNERVGIKDCHGMRRISPKRYREMISALDSEIGLYPIPYEYAVTLIRDALFVARSHRALISPEFAFRRRIFGADELTPRQHIPVFPEILLARVRRNLDRLLASSDYLVDESPFDNWWLDTPQAYAFFTRFLGRRKNRLPSKAVLTAFINDVIEPERPHFIRRLGLTVELLAKFDSNHPSAITQTALALWIALQDESRPLASIPFFQELAELTSEMVLNNIALGYREPEGFLPEHYQ